MVRRNSIAHKLAGVIRVAVYVRMSTTKQEDSPERQLQQIIPHAEANGYTIVETYQDLGIAGDELERRPAFQRLLADAKAGKFERILVDDLSRLGRFDALTWGAVLDPLRRAGIVVETISQGELRWNDMGARIMALITGEQRHGEQRNLARNTLTGMTRAAAEGRPLGGRAPYGYVWADCPVLVRKLVPDGHKAEAVKFIFSMAAEGHSLRGIADALRERHIPSPTGAEFWFRHTLRVIIKNRRYTGDMTWGAVSQGKFWGLSNGNVEERPVAKRHCVRNDSWSVRPESHEPLVERDTWEAAQRALEGKRGKSTPLPNGGDFLLSKLLTCGHCGSFLVGSTRQYKDREAYRVYRCNGYVAHGKEFCRGHNLHEAPMVKLIIRLLRDAYLREDRLAVLREQYAAQEADRTSDEARARLEKRLAALTRDIDKAAENLTLTSADLRHFVEAKMRQMVQERRGVETELEAIKAARPLEDFDAVVDEVREGLLLLEKAMKGKNPPLLRQLLREWVVKVECLSDVTTWKNGKEAYSPAGGVLVVRQDALLGNLYTSGRRRCSRR